VKFNSLLGCRSGRYRRIGHDPNHWRDFQGKLAAA
jgi:hypothetical protein